MPDNGSNVAARTLPGVNSKGAFFTRGSGHNKYGGYTETPDEYQEVMDRLLRKHKEAAGFVPAPIVEKRKGARTAIITIGGCDQAVREALDILASQGTPMDYMRLRAFPFDEPVEKFIMAHDYCYVVEQNRDAQAALAACARDRGSEGKAEIDPGLRRFSAERKTRSRSD